MKRVFIILSSVWLVCSCANYPKDPKGGVMIFDGVEYRECGIRYLYAQRKCNLTHKYGDDFDYYCCDYYSYIMSGEVSGTAYIGFVIYIPCDVFETRTFFSSDDYDFSHDKEEFTLTIRDFSDSYEILHWTLSVEIKDILNSETDATSFRESFSARYEYEMTVVDDLGISHQVTGWSEYLEK